MGVLNLLFVVDKGLDCETGAVLGSLYGDEELLLGVQSPIVVGLTVKSSFTNRGALNGLFCLLAALAASFQKLGSLSYRSSSSS